ncbi:MAG TPA: tannase/feruloyl esterase family alpha/beta hydrolase [Burkholderiaceae bacterium]|nr:tannase/feruloyl esterase family alpha/beta hydrolase [Burkholderiaceae bacterium]
MTSRRDPGDIAVAAIAALAAMLAAACGTTPPAVPALTLGADPAAACAALTAPVPANAIGLPSGGASIESAVLVPEAELAVAARGPSPAARITPPTPRFCRLLGQIAPLDPQAPPIRFQVNLPLSWNGRTVQYGGGGFNGTLITAQGLIPAARFDRPTPLASGYVTYGTDSGHQMIQGKPVQTFALNDEALLNFAYASYKKVRDVAVFLVQRAYGTRPEKLYFVGSSEGGREGLTMAQRYPLDFDGIFSRVPVIHWTGLQHAGTRAGMASMGEAWLGPAQVKLVNDAVLAACDARDGLADGIVSDAVGCRKKFDIAALQCAPGAGGDTCLSEAQVRAVQTLHSSYRFPFPLANGLQEYPGWGVSGEATPAFASTGGWSAWWLGSAPPMLPPQPNNGIAWIYGGGAIQYFYARDPNFDIRRYRPEDFAPRVREISALMDSTNPDLRAFHARGGKLIMLEHMADYAQSPYAGIGYYEAVVALMGRATVDRFMRLYTAPGVDHVGSGAPANVDMFAALVDWVERGRAPAGLELVEQPVQAPFPVQRARPLCEWPQWPRYKGGDATQASSFECTQ